MTVVGPAFFIVFILESGFIRNLVAKSGSVVSLHVWGGLAHWCVTSLYCEPHYINGQLEIFCILVIETPAELGPTFCADNNGQWIFHPLSWLLQPVFVCEATKSGIYILQCKIWWLLTTFSSISQWEKKASIVSSILMSLSLTLSYTFNLQSCFFLCSVALHSVTWLFIMLNFSGLDVIFCVLVAELKAICRQSSLVDMPSTPCNLVFLIS